MGRNDQKDVINVAKGLLSEFWGITPVKSGDEYYLKQSPTVEMFPDVCFERYDEWNKLKQWMYNHETADSRWAKEQSLCPCRLRNVNELTVKGVVNASA